MSGSSTLRWQRWLLLLCAIGFVVWTFSLLSYVTWRGQAEMTFAFTSAPFHDRITAVATGGPADKAGIRPGDVVDLTAVAAADRWRFRFGFAAGHPCTYVLWRGNSQRRVTLRPAHSDIYSYWWEWTSFFAGALGALIFATLIAWLPPWLVEARVLCLLLVASVLWPGLANEFLVTPWAALDAATTTIGLVIVSNLSVALIVTYTLLFGHPVSTGRRAVAAVTFIILVVRGSQALAFLAGAWSGAFDLDWAHIPVGFAATLRLLMLPVLDGLVICAVVLAFCAMRGRERSLFAWTMALPFVGYLMQAVHDVAQANSAALIQWLPAYDAVLRVAGYIVSAAEFFTPFAIGYALLSRSRFSPMTAAVRCLER